MMVIPITDTNTNNITIYIMTDEKKFRVEADLLGELNVPADALYGVQTQRGINNYHISRKTMCDYPDFIIAIAYVKLAAAQTNHSLGVINDEISGAMAEACREIIDGKWHENFPIDMVQGGAGTSVNMNANEVIANRALEILGRQKGDYQYVSPNDHCNCGQSTNDVYPTSIRLALIRMNLHLVKALTGLISAFRYKGEEYTDTIKMGRTQLQDAVPMTVGQEFKAYANNLEEEILNLERNVKLLHEINMGGTAIGTGLNAVPGFAKLCAANLSKLTGENFISASDLVEATPDTGAYVSYSSALKRLAIKLSKICNDLRLMASGPRCGLNEINLPPKAPGSSIMPGKVNPVIPEVTNQVCFKVRELRRRSRPAGAQRDGAYHHREPLREPHLAEECHRDPYRRVHPRYHRQQGTLLRDGQEQHWHRDRPEPQHRLQEELDGSQGSPRYRPLGL